MSTTRTIFLFISTFAFHLSLIGQPCGSPGNPNPDQPVFTFSANNICAQQDVDMTITSPQSGVSYSWDFGDNSLPIDSVPEGTTITHAFAPDDNGTTYTVTAYALSPGGCITSYSLGLTTLPTPDIEVSGVFSACLASNSTQTEFTTGFQITNHNGGNYTWDFGDGTVINTTDTEVVHTYVGYGTYDLTITQDNGTCTGTYMETVRFLKRPTANMNIVGDADICEGDTLYVANGTTSSNVDFYVLDWGDGNRDTILTTDTLSHVYDFGNMDPCSFPQMGQEYEVTLIAVNQCFEHTNGSPIFISVPPQTIFSGPSYVCSSNPVADFTNETCPDGGGGFDSNTYVWTFGDPTTGNQDTSYVPDPSHTFSGPGTYTITLTASSNCGSVTSTGEIIVYEDPIADGSFTTDSPIVTSNGDGCGPLEVSVLENSTGDSLNVSWTVSPGTGWTQTGGNALEPVYTFTDPGSYFLSLEATNLCSTANWDTIVVVLGEPGLVFNPTSNGCDSYNYNPSVVYNTGGGAFSSYSWSFPGGVPATSSDPNPGPIFYGNPGTYTATLTATTECGTATESQTFTVFEGPSSVDAGPDLTVCNSDPSFTLTGNNPIGGIWFGPGVTNPSLGIFDPATAGLGTHTINYSFSQNGCPITDTRIITVQGPPSVDAGPSVDICEDEPAFNFSGFSPAGGTWAGSGITNASLGTFDPAVAGLGTFTASYTYVDPVSGCGSSDLKLISVNPVPTVSLGAPVFYCVTPVDISLPAATPTGGIWTGPGVVDGNLGTFNSISAGGVGNYILTYSYTNASGCSDSEDLDVTVTTIITPDAGPDQDVCEDEVPFSLTGFSPIGGTWTGSGITDPAGVFDPSSAGIGTHTLTYTYGAGTCAQSDVMTIQVLNVPNVDAGTDLTVCEDEPSFNLSGANPPGGIWSGTGIISPAGEFDPATAGSGSFTLTYTYTHPNGCDVSDTRVVNINPMPTITLPAPLSICNSANDYTISGYTPGGGTWSGTGITNASAGIFNPFAAGGVGSYVVTYSYTDGNGCSNSATLNIEVQPPIVPDAGEDIEVCIDGGAFSLNGFSPLGGTWSGTGITNANGVFDPSVAGTGTHTLTYTYGSGTCERTDTRNVYVSPLPVVSAGPDIEICEDANAFSMTGFSPPGGTWAGAGVTDPAGTFDPTGLGDGIFNLTYTYINTYGCQAEDTRAVIINGLPTINMPAPITYCETNVDLTLTGYSPTGGTWSGTGIVDGLAGTFNPVAAGGIGSYTLTYNYTDGNSCSSSATFQVNVTAASVPDAGPNEGFCITDPAQTLTGATPSGGTFSGSGITDPVNGVFDPGTAGVGTHTITYTTGSGSCQRSDIRTITVGGIPVVLAGADLTVCSADAPFTLTGESPSGGTWSGTGVNGSQFNPSAVGVGSYNITYTYIHPVSGCENSDTRVINVQQAPTVFAGNDISYCNIPTDITLTGYSPSGGIWSGPGLVDAVAGIFNTVQAGGVGTYNLIYTYTSNNSCQSSDTVQIVVTPLATVSAGPDEELCINDGVQTLNGTPLGGTWSGPGIIDPVNGLFDPANAGQGLHILTYTYGSGTCQQSDVTRYLVGVPPTVLTGNDLEVCEGDPAFPLSGFSPQGGSWSGNGIIDPAGVFSPNTAGLGAHVITYTYTNIVTGCFNTSTQVVTVNALPVVDAGDTLNICASSTDIMLTGQSPIGGSWTGPGIVDGNAGIFNSMIAGGAGTYTLTYSFTNSNGCENTDTRTVIVINGPAIEAGPNESVCLSTSAFSLTGFSPTGGTWTGPGIVNSSGVFDPAVAGPGTHTLIYNYGNGTCISADSKTIFVGQPNPLITGANLTVCDGSSAFTLTGFSPQGGTWSGSGITDPAGVFDPAIGIGTYTLTYTYTSPVTGCVSTGTRSVQVTPLPTVNAGPDVEICDNLANYQLTGFAPTGGSWSGTGIVDATNGLFNTVAAGGLGTYTLTYTFVDGNGCSNSDTKEITVVEPDPIEAGPNQALCVGDGLLQLTGFSPAGGTWSGAGIVNPSTGVFDPSVAGTGTHILVYEYGVGTCNSTDTKIVTVGSPAAIIAGPDQEVCENDLPFSFSGFSPTGGYWTGPGITDSSGVFDPSITGIGIHTLTYTYFNTTTGCNNLAYKTVTVNGLPIVDAGSDLTICNNSNNYTLTGQSPAGGTWSGPGIVNSNNGSFSSILAGGVGSYTLTYTYVDGNGCEAADQRVVDVIAPPVVNAGPDMSVCIDEPTISLTGFSPAGGSWSGNGIINGTLGNFSPQDAGPGLHTISYTFGTGTCQVTDTRTIFVGQPTPIQTGANNSVCEDETAFTLTGFSPTGGYWTGPGITDSLGIFDPQITGSGTFSITYTYLNQVTGCINSESKNVIVRPLPTVNAGPDLSVCEGVNNVNLNGQNPTGGSFSGPGIVEATGVFNSISAGGIGQYDIVYTFTDQYGCTNFDSLEIEVIFGDSVNAGPDISICITDGNQVLSGQSPAGGSFSGPGIVDAAMGIFDPQVAGPGEHFVSYTSGTGSCEKTDIRRIFVGEPAVITPGPSMTVCAYQSTVTLGGFSPSGGTWSGLGIVDPIGIFDPQVTGIGNFTITYTYYNPATGCVSSGDRQINVVDPPAVSAGPDVEYCNSLNDIQLTGFLPSGGFWSGPGIVESQLGIFNPTLAGGVGDYNLVYSYTGNNGCTNSDTLNINIIEADPVEAGPNFAMCITDDVVSLDGFSPPGGTWSGNGIVDEFTGLFNPETAGSGTHVITYTVGSGTCIISDTRTINVGTVPPVEAGAQVNVCEGSPSFTLSGFSPQGGFWTGSGIIDSSSVFDPVLAGTGVHSITYTYVHPVTGCTNSDTRNVLVRALPVVEAGDPTTYCNSGENIFLEYYTPEGGFWAGPGIIDANFGVFNSTNAGGVGIYTLVYTYSDNFGCANSDSLILEIVQDPVIDAGPDTAVCVDAGQILLSGNPSGGSYYGPGIVDPIGVFDPQLAGPGTYNIAYVQGLGSCQQEDVLTILVGLPEIVDAGAPEQVCIDFGLFQMAAAQPANGVWSGPGISDPDLGIFDTEIAGLGQHTFTYTYTDSLTGCVSSDTKNVVVNPLPSVFAGYDDTFCENPNPIILDGFSPSGGTWSGLGIVDEAGIFSSVDAGGIGTYPLIYTFTNANGCTNSDTVNIEIILGPQVNAGPDLNLCIDDPVQSLTGTPTGGIFEGPGIINQSGLFNPELAGPGYHTITYYYGTQTCERSDQRIIYVGTPADVDAGLDQDACIGELPFSLGGSPTGGFWQGLGVDSTGIFDPSLTGLGTFSLTYTFTDQLTGCTASDVMNVQVNGIPAVEAGDQVTYCTSPQQIQLSGFSPMGGVWQGPGIVDPSQGLFSTTAAGGVGNYTLVYTYSDSNGCSNSDTLEVQVTPGNTVDAGPDLTLCIDQGPYPLDQFSPSGGYWQGPGVTDPVQGIFDPAQAGAGVHQLTYTEGQGSCERSDTRIVEVVDVTAVSAGPSQSFCLNDPELLLTGNTPAGGVWSGTGITDPVSGAFDPALAGQGTHTISYTYTDPASGCSATDTKEIAINPLPVANFAAPVEACVGEEITFANSSINASSYQWNFGDNGTSFFESPEYMYDDPGIFTVTLVATTAFGCADTISYQIDVAEAPTALFERQGQAECGPLTLQFDNLSQGVDLEYYWDFGNGLISSDAQPGEVIFQPGVNDTTYLVTLEVTNRCGTDTYTMPIEVDPIPSVNFGTNVVGGCTPLSVNFTNITQGYADDYYWDFGNGQTSTDSIPGSVIFTADSLVTTYTITLIATNECGADTSTQTVTVTPGGVTSFFNVDNNFGCAPLPVQFNNFSTPGSTITWDFGDGNFSVVPSPLHVYDTIGTFTVIQYVSNVCGMDSSTTVIEVAPPSFVAFTHHPFVCLGQEITFNNSSDESSGFEWDFGDGNTSTLTNPVHMYALPGDYTVTLTSFSPATGCPSTYTSAITVLPNPVASFAPDVTNGCAPLDIQFTNTSDSNNFSSWDFGDGNISVANSPAHTFEEPGNYVVTLVTTDLNGCFQDTSISNIIVHPKPSGAFDTDVNQLCDLSAEVRFINQSTDASAYFWDFGNGQTSVLTNPVVGFDGPGDYPVTLMTSNQFGCTDTLVQTFTVYEGPVADLSMEVQSGCQPLVVNFQQESFGSNTFRWDFGDGTYSDEPNPTHVYTEPGKYSVELIASINGICADTLRINNAVWVLERPDADFESLEFEDVSNTGTIEFTNTSTGAQEYFWDFGDGNTSVEENPAHRYEGNGSRQVYLIATNEYACSDTIVRTVTPEFFGSMFIPNALSPETGVGDTRIWRPSAVGLIEYRAQVFSPWGELLWESTAIDGSGMPIEGWDGRYKGDIVPQGAYVWKVWGIYEDGSLWPGVMIDGVRRKIGSVTVLR